MVLPKCHWYSRHCMINETKLLQDGSVQYDFPIYTYVVIQLPKFNLNFSSDLSDIQLWMIFLIQADSLTEAEREIISDRKPTLQNAHSFRDVESSLLHLCKTGTRLNRLEEYYTICTLLHARQSNFNLLNDLNSVFFNSFIRFNLNLNNSWLYLFVFFTLFVAALFYASSPDNVLRRVSVEFHWSQNPFLFLFNFL